jgi:hypothetical protein
MKLSDLIEELQELRGEHGDLDVYLAGDVGGLGDQANKVEKNICFELIPETNKRYYRTKISSGCKCMSCEDEVLINEKSLLIY